MRIGKDSRSQEAHTYDMVSVDSDRAVIEVIFTTLSFISSIASYNNSSHSNYYYIISAKKRTDI